MDQYHEPVAELSPLDRDFVRALMSLKEEIEAINWYHQRVSAATDPQIKAIMAHNRDEEMEHAIMRPLHNFLRQAHWLFLKLKNGIFASMGRAQ